jgi:choline transport protein
VPINALVLLTVLSCLLALINIGSTTAFSAILSLSTLAQYISYFFPIAFFLVRKIQGPEPRYGPIRMPRLTGIMVNIFALVWCVFMIIWLPFPTFLPVTKDTMNYAAPVWIAGCIFAIGDYFWTGKTRFKIPQREEDYPQVDDEDDKRYN